MNASSTEERNRLIKHAVKSESRAGISNMIAVAESERGIPVLPDELDSDPWLLNVVNGTVNLRTGDLLNHRKSDLITKVAPVKYDRLAKAPIFEDFLNQIMDGDQDLIAYLQRAVGIALVGKVEEHVLFFLHGLGANGKSTFLSALVYVMGDYAKQAEPELLVMKRGEVHPTGVADLFGTRLVASTEVEAGRRLAEVLVKQLTGGDLVKARFLYQNFFQFSPSHTIFLAANHKPVVRGTDLAIWRRIQLVPFTVTIPPAQQDPHLGDKLRAEAAGILAWAVQGCLDWQSGGLKAPKSVQQATEEYRQEMDLIGDFLAQECYVQSGEQAGATDLFNAYREWCKKGKEMSLTQTAFGRILSERGFTSGTNSEGYKVRHGLRLLNPPFKVTVRQTGAQK
jgi:putative DNA primase/helicase